MAIIEQQPLELETGRPEEARPMGGFTRPTGLTGWGSWFTTVDHKKIGIMYGIGAMFFFIVGGFEALLIRLQLARPGGTVLSADLYNQVFTMHGVTMVFFFVMPLAAAFVNYMVPLQIGAADVAFPRMNAFSFWCWLAGAVFLNSSWFFGGGADGGWFAYAPNTSVVYSPGHGIDFFVLGLLLAGIASTVSALNLIVTIVNMRTEGMTMMRMPIFTWMSLITQFLLAFALPVITIALFLLLFDRLFDANFFNVEQGADPLLWQHLFWIFGHPEVYIIVLPSFGILSEVIPTFSRKPIFGYPFMVFSGVAIAFLGFGVWAHHMFASGMGPVSVAAFAAATMFIAVPTGVKVLNWLATMWGGSLKFTVAMMFAIATVAMFTIGGLSGVTHSIAPSDTQQTDSYYIVGHFHYTIFGGGALGLFTGLYYWWPKMFGYMLSERIGRVGFWFTFVGFNMTFIPMHIVGLQGMPRRYHIYDTGLGFEFGNLVSTVGAFTLAIGVGIFLVNTLVSRRAWSIAGRPDVGPDPWDARSLEWMVQSPPPVHNFDEPPVVESVDEFWHRKYTTDDDGTVRRVATGAEVAQPGIPPANLHLPSPSYFPIILAIGLLIIAYGLIYTLWLCVLGLLFVLAGLYGWVLEPSVNTEEPHGLDDHGSEDDDAGTEPDPAGQVAAVGEDA
ncbi:MAG: cytochrome c oxidase subunit I [Acidimicrobiales bacterium]